MNEKIHFDDFAEQVALEVGVDVDTAKDYIYTMFETIIEENEKGEWVKIRNFGSFHPVHNKERRTRNPQTGNFMTVPAHYHVNFKASETLSKIVNVKYGHLHPKVIEEERKNAMPVVIGSVLILVSLVALLFLLWPSGDEKKAPVQAPVIQQDEADLAQPVQEEKPAVEELPAMEEAPTMHEAPAMHEAIGDDVVEGEEPERYEAMAQQEAEATETAPERIAVPRVGEVGITYTVQQHDTLTEISEDTYENSDYWPLIFSKNYLVVRDPDLIRPKTELAIPGRPDLTDSSDMENMYGGYIQAYHRYKGLGKDQKAIWLLFRGYVKVDKGILDHPDILEEDRVEVRDYIRRYDP
jgi:nucleoid DNA-binding protein